MYIYIYVFIYIYALMKKQCVPSRLSPQWLFGNFCTWPHDVWLHIADTYDQLKHLQIYIYRKIDR